MLRIGDLSVRIPVIQGGMGIGVSLSRLAGTVAACGGVGVLSAAQIGWREPDFYKKPLEANLRALKNEIKKARELAKGGVLAVNIMVATRHYEEYVKAAVEAGIDLIISGAGLPVNLPELVKDSTVKIAPIVSSLKSAKVICKMWDRHYQRMPDLVVIEGPKAGGHLGFSEEELTYYGENPEAYEKQIREICQLVASYGEKYHTEIPVAAAGGIFDAEDAKKVMELGVNAVQVATRFVTTEECDASDAFKQSYIRAQKEDIMIVKSPVGMPGRAIRNPFTSQNVKKPVTHCYQCIRTCKPQDTPYCITEALIRSVEGDTEQGLIFCGTNAWRCNKIESVEQVMKEFEKTL